MNIIFFGSSDYVIPIIETLNKNFNLILVVTTEKPKINLASQKETLRDYPVIEYCVENIIPYLSVQQLNNSIIQQLQKLKCPVAVLADFGLIIPPEIINLFPKGIISIHPSLLPKYRGSTPAQAAILNGEKITGVSIMKLDEKIDHGPILTQVKEGILDADTSKTLYKRLFKKSSNLLSKVINSYLEGNLKLLTQNHAKATFTKSISRQDGFIDISSPELNIKDLKLKIRAYYPWPGIWFKIKLNEIIKTIKLLPEKIIQVEGKKPVSYKDFLNGYPKIKQQLGKLLKQLA